MPLAAQTQCQYCALEDIDFLLLLGKRIMNTEFNVDYPTHKSCDLLGKVSAPGFSHQIKTNSYQQHIIK